MCGIAGIVASDRLLADDPARVTRMRDVIAHRGPDDAGIFVDERAALGHRRLSIVDLAAGHQPLANEDESIWIIFNGEIYNHASVRPELESAGHRYRTRSDTETIVHAYEQWGDACVERLRGMFAFAIWDARRARLLLARDRLGVKPLYWALAGNRMIFGSEIKAILESGLIAAEADDSRIPEQLEHPVARRNGDALQRHSAPAAGTYADLREWSRPHPALLGCARGASGRGW